MRRRWIAASLRGRMEVPHVETPAVAGAIGRIPSGIGGVMPGRIVMDPGPGVGTVREGGDAVEHLVDGGVHPERSAEIPGGDVRRVEQRRGHDRVAPHRDPPPQTGTGADAVALVLEDVGFDALGLPGALRFIERWSAGRHRDEGDRPERERTARAGTGGCRERDLASPPPRLTPGWAGRPAAGRGHSPPWPPAGRHTRAPRARPETGPRSGTTSAAPDGRRSSGRRSAAG